MNLGNLKVYGIIYKIENTKNKKVYIGQTTNKRGFDGRYKYKGKDIERVYGYLKYNIRKNKRYNIHLFNAIEKYGFKSFRVNKILDIAFSLEELNIKEELWIKYYNSTNKDYGYNHQMGGSNKKVSKEYCATFSKKQLGFDIMNFKNFIINSYKNGISGETIGNILNISCQSVYKYLKQWGVIIRKKGVSKIIDHKETIINMYVENFMSIKEISKIFNVAPTTISNLIKDNDIKLRSCKNIYIDENKEEIIKLYNEGYTQKQIAIKFNVSNSLINSRLKQWNIKTRSYSETALGFNIEKYIEEIKNMYKEKKHTNI